MLEKFGEKPGIDVFGRNRPISFEGIEPTHLTQFRVPQEFTAQRFDARVLEHDSGQDAVPHSAEGIVVATPFSLFFQGLPWFNSEKPRIKAQADIWERRAALLDAVFY